MLEALRAENFIYRKHVQIVQAVQSLRYVQAVLRIYGQAARFREFSKRSLSTFLAEAKKRHRVKLFGFCLMPNHFHLVLEPAHQTALSQFMQWLLTSHVRRYHKHYGSSGHIWQGRFKSCPVQRDEHLITVLRYVLQNPVRGGLSATAREWSWSSLRRPQLTDRCPVDEDRQWLEQLDEPMRADQLAVLRECLNRQRPFGKTDWQAKMAATFGLGSTLRPRGRPRIEKKSSLSFLS